MKRVLARGGPGSCDFRPRPRLKVVGSAHMLDGWLGARAHLLQGHSAVRPDCQPPSTTRGLAGSSRQASGALDPPTQQWDVPLSDVADWERRASRDQKVLRAPAVFRGLAAEWCVAARTEWHPDSLRRLELNRTVTASYSRAGCFDAVDLKLDVVEYAALEDMALRDALDLIEAEAQSLAAGETLEERVYLAEPRTPAFAQALLPMLPTPAWHRGWPVGEATVDSGAVLWSQPFFPRAGDPGASSQATIWMSAGATVAPPHRDVWFNVSCTLEGTKTFLLAPPDAHREVSDVPRACARLERRGPGDFVPVRRTSDTGEALLSSGNSPLDFRELASTGTATFPLAEVRLEPGDVMFLPPDWYHQVESAADPTTRRSVAVNFWSEKLFGWAVADDPSRAARLAAIESAVPSRPYTLQTVPWDSFMD